MLRRFVYTLVVSLLMSCTYEVHQYHECEQVSLLRANLLHLSGNYILLGQYNSLFFMDDDIRLNANKPDVHYPALFGWDIGNIGNKLNNEGIPFDSIISYIKAVHRLGGINSVRFHATHPVTGHSAWTLNKIPLKSILPRGEFHQKLINQLDLLAVFFSQLIDDVGLPIPVIFIPWHDMNGDWFWWGNQACTKDEYKKLFRFTVQYLRFKKSINHLLVAYSPDAGALTPEAYMERYPGDDVVDILGLNNYCDFNNNRLDLVVQKLSFIADIAHEKEKLFALTETGIPRSDMAKWHTNSLLPVLKANEKTLSLSYVMIVPNLFEGHSSDYNTMQLQHNDYVDFTNEKMILLLHNYKSTKK